MELIDQEEIEFLDQVDAHLTSMMIAKYGTEWSSIFRPYMDDPEHAANVLGYESLSLSPKKVAERVFSYLEERLKEALLKDLN